MSRSASVAAAVRGRARRALLADDGRRRTRDCARPGHGQARDRVGKPAARLRDLQRQLRDAEESAFSAKASRNVVVGLLSVNQVRSTRSSIGCVARAWSCTRARQQLGVRPRGRAVRRPLGGIPVHRGRDVGRPRRAHHRARGPRQTASRPRGPDGGPHTALAERDTLRSEAGDLSVRVEASRRSSRRLGAVPVMGEAQLTGPQLAGVVPVDGRSATIRAGRDDRRRRRTFVEEGTAEGVRGDLAFAQAIIETGSFSVAAGNNYSGIGVCDCCTGGYAFATPRDGVRAQIQLLRNYADPDSPRRELAHPPSPALYGADAPEGRPPLRHVLPQG